MGIQRKKKQIEGKWEEMHEDCLIKIFERVGVVTLMSGVSSVCKSWYKATQSSDCWKVLDFQVFTVSTWLSNDKFIKSAVDRSQGVALQVFLPKSGCSSKTLEYISNGCPSLKMLTIPHWVVLVHHRHIAKLIGKLKHLETLDIGNPKSSFNKILAQISIHCFNFTTLVTTGCSIRQAEASAIATMLKNIKCLVLKGSHLPRKCLKIILSECTKLEVLDVSDCVGFKEDDTEILVMAGHIKHFESKGAKLSEDFDEDDEEENDHPMSGDDIDIY